ncbi:MULTISPECIES: MgtC/SapB family protein [Cytobacillus]|uniref:MgtC/SapB family protein n=1 Tax=Cytobacillus TaxID=2675230 RepID=UPI00203E1841|nr:MgtC/SapB family protein [Cytobacillus firmus]MCM3706951.1 MgtC/SapB family protein [Cytobacillus firmus]
MINWFANHFFTVNPEIYLRIFLSMIMGAIIGYERSSKGKPAGIRTYSLISLGSTLIMVVSIFSLDYIVSQHTYNEQISIVNDPTRIAAQVVSGIGFIGAGIVYTTDLGKKVGLTSAAQLWATAMVGLTIGVGMYDIAFLTLICIIFIVKLVDWMHFMRNKRNFLKKKQYSNESPQKSNYHC